MNGTTTENTTEKRELDLLRQKVDMLSVELADLKGAFKAEIDSTCEHVVSLNAAIADIYDYLIPVVRKLFPNFAATQHQISRVIGRSRDIEGPRPSRTSE